MRSSILLAALERVLAQQALWPVRRALDAAWYDGVDRLAITVLRGGA